MRWPSLFLACQQLNSGTNLRERIRSGSTFKWFLCFVLIDVRCFHVLPKSSSRTPGCTCTPYWNHCSVGFLLMDTIRRLEAAGFLLSLFDPEDGGYMFLRNVGWLSTDYSGLLSMRQYSLNSSYFALTVQSSKKNSKMFTGTPYCYFAF
jgi:hypothetical protein